MPTKDFQGTVRFYEHVNPDGSAVWLPLVQVTLITPSRSRVALSLMFDTGASVTSLSRDFYHLLGLTSWDQGQRVPVGTANGAIDAYRYEGITFEILGKTITCAVHLLPMAVHPLYGGLLGRETVFNEFGFGFWETTHEIFVTRDP